MSIFIDTDKVRIGDFACPYALGREGFVFVGDGGSRKRQISLCFDVSSLVSDVFGFGNSHVATGIEQRRGTVQQGIASDGHGIASSNSPRLHLFHICQDGIHCFLRCDIGLLFVFNGLEIGLFFAITFEGSHVNGKSIIQVFFFLLQIFHGSSQFVFQRFVFSIFQRLSMKGNVFTIDATGSYIL